MQVQFCAYLSLVAGLVGLNHDGFRPVACSAGPPLSPSGIIRSTYVLLTTLIGTSITVKLEFIY